ncbi:hypothetical protein [Nocardia flavorosea]|uniref:hypothetical protein n=1 Tax=Nocardia flavorosea TaxID=53429 RepID=UPI001E2BA40B|nr:hypothetical protein [Nocardia flavorosea]
MVNPGQVGELGAADPDAPVVAIAFVRAAGPTTPTTVHPAPSQNGSEMRDYNFTSDFARKYLAEGRAQFRAKGEAEGRAISILTVLDARGIEVPDQVRATITSCDDLDQLQKWLRRALEINRADELLDGSGGAATGRGAV